MSPPGAISRFSILRNDILFFVCHEIHVLSREYKCQRGKQIGAYINIYTLAPGPVKPAGIILSRNVYI
jgi:hypothetical protein